ncbi:MAG: HPr-rel-A system PqqD family peptide chaperone [Candidatus Competibacteraceae bacterium]|nr:HPr-rel-A system PqqD family peptide chaperone [Candidatus Competibacteraceae bacterium]
MRWRIHNGRQHYWRHWDVEKFVLFNAHSAQTHQLTPFAVDILSLLKDQSLDFAELSERLISIYGDLEFDAEVTDYLHQTLSLLDDLGLIEPESR